MGENRLGSCNDAVCLETILGLKLGIRNITFQNVNSTET